MVDILVWCEEGGYLIFKEGYGVGIFENRGYFWVKWIVVFFYRGWSVMYLLWDSCLLVYLGGVFLRVYLEWVKVLRSFS